MSLQRLSRVRIRNFKAIRDSGPLKFGPLTVFIGDNGSGKSSVIEAMQFLSRFVMEDLDRAFESSRGFDHLRYKGAPKRGRRDAEGRKVTFGPIEIELAGYSKQGRFVAETTIGERDTNEVAVLSERVRLPEFESRRDDQGRVRVTHEEAGEKPGGTLYPDVSLLADPLGSFIESWQFLDLNVVGMGAPILQKRTAREVRLMRSGSNLAEYLLSLRDRDVGSYNGLLEAFGVVLPYAADLQPVITSELERSVYLQLKEADFDVPGWMLSTGTLRLLALLALLRQPEPPPVIFIEEIENGLDPRTLHMIAGEIQRVVGSGRTQVIATTHSPYLLDLLPLDAIVVVDRVDGQPAFRRPADNEEVREWAKEFSPGSLYTMSRFERER